MLLYVSSTVVLIIRRSKLYYTASGIVTLCMWQVCRYHDYIHNRLPEDEPSGLKHVEDIKN